MNVVADIESYQNPLVVEEEVVVVEKVESFGRTARTAVVVGSLLSLGAVAYVSYQPSQSTLASSATSLSIFESREDISFCPSVYVYGVTQRTADRGCVVVSKDDLFDNWVETGLAFQAGHVCVGSSDKDGLLEVDYETMVSMGIFYDEETGLHTVSGIAPGLDVDVQLFEGKNFDGRTTTIMANEDGRLPMKFYPDGTPTNDNVGSFILKSVADHYFAGKSCNVHAQVCPVVLTPSQILADPAEGCIIMATRDPRNLNADALTKAVRVCSDVNSPELQIDKMALTAMGMVQRDGKKESEISYFGKGPLAQAMYFEKDTPGEGSKDKSGGSLNKEKFPSGKIVNDNIYSVRVSGHGYAVPTSCEM